MSDLALIADVPSPYSLKLVGRDAETDDRAHGVNPHNGAPVGTSKKDPFVSLNSRGGAKGEEARGRLDRFRI